jgi:hypothetical protein
MNRMKATFKRNSEATQSRSFLDLNRTHACMTSRNSTSLSEFSFIVSYFGAYNAEPFVAYEFRLFGGYTL